MNIAEAAVFTVAAIVFLVNAWLVFETLQWMVARLQRIERKLDAATAIDKPSRSPENNDVTVYGDDG